MLRNNNNVYLNVTEWLASPSGAKFSKPIEEMSEEEPECLSDVVLHFCEEQRWHVLQKFIDEVDQSRH